MKFACVVTVLALASCQNTLPRPKLPPEPSLASATRASDYATYGLQRVGIVPFHGKDLALQQARALQQSFGAELSAAAPYEIVPLDARDLEEVAASDPLRRGHYRPQTIIELARRYRLDGLFVGTVTHQRAYEPQQLALELELVATETGQAIWSSSILLDAGDQHVQRCIAVWCNNEREDSPSPETPALIYLSPARFARFAAREVARVL